MQKAKPLGSSGRPMNLENPFSTTAKHIFLTGGLGYVGGRCSQWLAGEGYRVSIGTRRNSTLVKPSWLSQGQLSYYDTELAADDLVKSFAGVDVIVHLASPNEHTAARDPEAALRECTIATLRLCQAAKLASVKQLIFFSTAHVYASPLIGSFDEASLPEPKHPYAYSHLAAEHVIRSFAGESGIPSCTILRLTNSFGAPERLDVDRWTLLVNDLCKQAVTTGSLTLNSDGSGLRDFVCLGDVARVVAHFVTSRPLQPFEVYNVGSGQSVTILDMAQLIASRAEVLLGKSIPIKTKPISSNTAAIDGHLNISVKKLQNSGFSWTGVTQEEIDRTLKLCISG